MNAPTGFDRARHAVPQLYELLRARIVSLELEPGASLSRPQMALEFGISQTPVREALLKLAEERLVDVFPQSATRVSLIDMAYAQETHFLRRAIELELVREIALMRPPALLARLVALLAQQEALRDAGDFDGFTEADQAFHRSMYQATGKDALWRLVRSRSGHIDRLRRLHLPAAGKLDRIVADHRQVLDAIQAGDALGAQDSLRQHLSGTLEYAETIRKSHPGFFTPG
ncbi:GntR family transcriptional regulator [Allopusillimonas ginsengisoli]|uniref:GntR family transcriptional regulator n=1 Tax=Allopusillimonas ginsengisoli TaxID=453575 RepID=UPI00102255C8|nr:GntR family transcriptional regulator [Allopusillimonas ginsengisoli]TEA76987.1 GntR family transcriptional regulator [Allopusillimonas ginsengisoli]